RSLWIRTGIAASVLLIAVVLVAMNAGGIRKRLFHRSSTTDAATQFKARPSVAVLGFKNLSGKEDEAWISSALSEMLAAEMSAGQELRVTPGEDIARMKVVFSLPAADSYSRKTLTKIRHHLNSDIVVLGSYLA